MDHWKSAAYNLLPKLDFGRPAEEAQLALASLAGPRPSRSLALAESQLPYFQEVVRFGLAEKSLRVASSGAATLAAR